MSVYEPNSHRSKEEKAETREKRVDKVIKGTAKTRKKSEISKIGEVFISEDVSKVKSYVLMDVLVPAIKKAISDIVTNGIDMILYGESGRTKERRSSNYVSYRDYSKRDERRSDRDETPRRNNFNIDDIVFESKGEALAVIDQMNDLIENFGDVSVADFYDMVDITAPYTSNKYGWTSVRYAEPVRVRDGYIIKLPRAQVL